MQRTKRSMIVVSLLVSVVAVAVLVLALDGAVVAAPAAAQIRVFKYEDLDVDGTKDSGEPGLGGWEFRIYNASTGSFVISGTTGSSGYKTWNNIAHGNDYSVCEQLQAGWMNTQPSDPDVMGPAEVCVNTGVLNDGDSTGFIDFGNAEGVQVRVNKYDDLDVDGSKDGGEFGLEDWEFTIYDASMGTFVISGTTGPNGYKTWNDLPPGEAYSVCEQLPADWMNTEPSDPDVMGPAEICVNTGVLTSGQSTGFLPFGNAEDAQIRVYKYEDLNKNGMDDCEPSLAGWEFKIYDADTGTEVTTGDTSSVPPIGYKTWSDIEPGKAYSVCEQLLAGWVNTEPSDPDVMGPAEICVNTNVLGSGESTGFIYFGNYGPGDITIVKETTPDGVTGTFTFTHDIQGGGTFTLVDDGKEDFTDVLAGTYQVTETLPVFGFELNGLGCTYANSSVDTSTGFFDGRVTIDLAPGDHVTCTFENTAQDSDNDGFYDSEECPGGPPCDRDGDGVPNHLDYDPTGYFYDEDTGEIIPGGSVAVNGPGAVNLIHDGSNGFYQFVTTQPGLYTIQVTMPPGYAWSGTCLDQGVLDPTGQPNPYSLGAGEDALNPGFLTSAACLDNVFYLQIDLQDGDPFIINNNFPLHELPVGGITEPVGRLTLLAPWVGLMALVAAGAALLVWRRRTEAV